MNKNKTKLTVLVIIVILLLSIESFFYAQNINNNISFANPLSVILVALAIAFGICLFLISRLLPKEKTKLIFWARFFGLWNAVGGILLEIVIITIKVLHN